jgi:alkaline phosphatase D
MPLRLSSMPQGPDMQLYRKLTFGSLAEFAILDTRQYRSDQPCGDRTNPLCPGVADPSATLLGAAQQEWLFDVLNRSQAKWNVLAQQVMMAWVDRSPSPEQRYSMDQWSGYDAARNSLLGFLGERKPSNPVVLTGDIHTNWVNDLKADFRDMNSATVATEFVGTSISSSGDGSDKSSTTDGMLAENPFVKFHNANRGYVSCELTPRVCRAKYQIVEYVSRKGAPLKTRASFVVEDGKPGAEPA